MVELSEDDETVVKRWWKCCVIAIYEKGYILDKYNPSLTPSHLPVKGGSFQDMVNAGAIIVRSHYSLTQFSLLSSCGSQ